MGSVKQEVWYVALMAVFIIPVFVSGCGSEKIKNKELTKTERARMLVEIANGALLEGDPTGALQYLARAELEDKKLPELYHSKALAYFAKHELNTAIALAQQAVTIQPDYSEANNTLGKLLVDSGKLDQAIAPLQKAANDPLYRDSYKAWTNLGILKYRIGEYSQAERMMTRAIQASPNTSCVAHYYRGHVHLRESHLDAAIQDYSEATKKFCANFSDAQFALGLAYQKNHQYEMARKTFLEIQKRYPNTKLAERAWDQLKFIP